MMFLKYKVGAVLSLCSAYNVLILFSDIVVAVFKLFYTISILRK